VNQTSPIARAKLPRTWLPYAAEWEKHDAIWLSWPYDKTTFPNRVDKAEATYVQIIKYIHENGNRQPICEEPEN
jgi:agmatine/peptidylarginine deiminase